MRMCTHIHRYTYLLSIASGSVWPKSCLFLSLSPDFSKAICSLLLPSIFLHHPLPLSFLPVFLWSLLFLPVSFSSFHSLNNQFSYHPASISSPLLCFSPPLISLISSSKALKFSVFLSLSGGEYTVIYISKQNQRGKSENGSAGFFSQKPENVAMISEAVQTMLSQKPAFFLCYEGGWGTAWPPPYHALPLNTIHYTTSSVIFPHYTAGNRWNSDHSHDAGSSEAPIFLSFLLCPIAVISSTPHIIPFRGRITFHCSGFTISTWTVLSGGRAPLCFLHPFQTC